MPIIMVENGYVFKLNSKNTKKHKLKFFSLLLVCCIAIVAILMLVFSKFNISALVGISKFEVYGGSSFYAVSLNSGYTFAEVSQNANMVKLQDGAGYVYQNGNTYYLLANIYRSKQDAERVLNNLTEYDASVVEIKFDKLVLNSNFSSTEIKELRRGIEIVDRFFETIHEITISFDMGEILDAEVRQKLQIFKETCQENKETFAKAFKDSGENIVTYVKIFHNEIISNLSALIISKNLSSDLKYISISTLVSFERFQQNVRK